MTVSPVLTVADTSTASSIVVPRWATERTPERPTFGPVVGAVSAAMGKPFMPHQQYAVDVGLEIQSEEAGDPDPGEWAYDQVAETMQRRGGKTTKITPLATHRARLIARARMFMTAQNRDKARARWMDATDEILASPLRHDVRRKVSQGFEELLWTANRGLLVPFAPNEEAMHSETPDLVFIDELWAFDDEARRMIQAGYVPAFATSGGQAWLMSTAGTDKSHWLNDVRTEGRAAVTAGSRLGTAYFEHGLPDRVDGRLIVDLNDEELVEACIRFHPAICHTTGCSGPRRGRPCPHGYTIRPAALRTAWSKISPRNRREEYLRAYGNRTANDVADHWRAIDEAQWTAQTDKVGIPGTARVAFGVWVDADGKDAAIAAAWRDSAGRMHVEHLKYDEGVRWVIAHAEAVAGRQDPLCVGVANVGPARDVADELAQAGVEVLSIAQADVKAACSRHTSELAAGSWWHRLDTAVTDSARAAVLERGAWARTAEGTPTLVGAQTLAGWAFDHAPEDDEPRRFRIG